MNKSKWLKLAGIVVTIGGFAMDILSDWYDEKKNEVYVQEQIEAAFKKRNM